MKYVIWTDKKGFQHRSMIRDTDPDSSAPKGIPCDPPDLTGVFENAHRDLHNLFVERGLFSYNDVVKAQSGIAAAILYVFKNSIVELFRKQEVKK